MSCIFSDVSGHSVKSVSTAQEQVLPCLILVGGNQGRSAATPQSERQGEAIIPRMEESINDALSIPETQSDRLSFPNPQEEEEEEEEEEEGEEEEEEGEEDVEEDGEEVEDDDEEEEDDYDDGNGKEGSQDEADDGDDGKEDGRREDTEEEEEVREHPLLVGGAPSEEVRYFFPLPLPSTSFYC